MQRLLLALYLFICCSLSAQETMIIASPPCFETSLENFIIQKQSQHIDCKLLLVQDTDIYTIKSQIDSLYQLYDANYLLLVGDYRHIPSFPLDEAYADAYYVCTDLDSLPYMSVGRFSVETSTELRYVIEKNNIPFEIKTASTIASNQLSELTGKQDFEKIRQLSSLLQQKGITTTKEFFDGSQGNLDAVGNPTAIDVINAINENCDLLLYAGHGDYDGWQTSGFTSDHIQQLQNTTFPIIFSASCLNGNFAQRTCFAEHWQRSACQEQPTGAKALFMSSAFSDWDAILESLTIVFDSMTNEISLGDIWKISHNYMKKNLLRKKDANTWLLFGDPSAKISFSKNSIASQNPSFFSIYPNPAKNFFMLQTENFTASTLEIYNFNGECLRKIQLSAPDETIDISTLPAGFYVLKSGSRTIVFQKE